MSLFWPSISVHIATSSGDFFWGRLVTEAQTGVWLDLDARPLDNQSPGPIFVPFSAMRFMEPIDLTDEQLANWREAVAR